MIIESHSTWEHFQARFPEWKNSTLLMAWGAYLLLHPGMFEDPRVATLWAGLALLAPQSTWGFVAMIVGLFRFSALYVNGRHQRTPLIRLIGSFASAFVWTQVLIGMLKTPVPNTGVIVYTGLIIADIYSAFRASADVTFVSRRGKAVRAELSRVAASTFRS